MNLHDQHIFRLTLKLHFSTKKCLHAFMLFELIGLKPMNISVISLLKRSGGTGFPLNIQ